MLTTRLGITVLLVFLLEGLSAAQSHHVKVGGGVTGDGSEQRPWDLQTALNGPRGVGPGDTIWVHAGVYDGYFIARLAGTPTQPLIVRGVVGERATLRGGTSPDRSVLEIHPACDYVWFWGLEITSSATDRWAEADGKTAAIPEGVTGLGNTSVGIKLINLVIHDVRQGVASFSDFDRMEIYGCVIYNFGYGASDRGHGHGIYMQNPGAGRKYIRNNIMGGGYGLNLQVYGSGNSVIDNITVERNIVMGYGFLIGKWRGEKQVGDSIVENCAWNSTLTVGYNSKGARSTVVNRNILVTHDLPDPWTPAAEIKGLPADGVEMRGNVIYRQVDVRDSNGVQQKWGTVFPDNRVYSTYPRAGDTSIVYRNEYDPRRVHIASYNWDTGDEINVHVSGVYKDGEEVYVYNAQNIYGDQPFRAIVTGGRLKIPMKADRWARAIPQGGSGSASTYPRFGSFVVDVRVLSP